MREVLELFAFYNKKANEAMMEILNKLPEDVLRKDMNTFHKSLLDTFMHVVLANFVWLKRTNVWFGDKYVCIRNSDILNTPDATIKDEVNRDHRYAFSTKSRLDDLFVSFAAELDESDLSTRVRYKNLKGQELERTYWHTILHSFNHETHCRGMISAMLDQLGVDNDYSGIGLYVG